MLLGAHMSIAGGIDKAFSRSKEIGCNAFQVFAKSPRGRNFVSDKLDNNYVNFALQEFEKYDQKRGVIHSIYLINLGKKFDDAQLDRKSVIDDFIVADKLGFAGVNIHLGKYGDFTKQVAISNMVENVASILAETVNLKPFFVFENTAGQGTEIGWNFAELGELYNELKKHIGAEIVENRIRFCIDTCHAWASGYDINNWDEMMKEFESIIGRNKILFIHLNDAKSILGSKLDRHANLGRGFIGLNALKKVILRGNDNNVPLILETPNMDLWQEEITMIKGIVSGEFDDKQINEFNIKYYKTEFLKKFESFSNSNGLF
ncbi:MAG: deoxyribonuclease IV [Candidatus Absconditabacteria bacterium]